TRSIWKCLTRLANFWGIKIYTRAIRFYF
ncbi:uncharacterized protein HPF67_1360, partial [Helicobacter pylori]